MANENKTENLDAEIEAFLTDPKHAREASIMRGSVKRILAEIATEEQERIAKEKKEEPGLFDFLFGSSKKDEK